MVSVFLTGIVIMALLLIYAMTITLKDIIEQLSEQRNNRKGRENDNKDS